METLAVQIVPVGLIPKEMQEYPSLLNYPFVTNIECEDQMDSRLAYVFMY